MYCYKCGKKIRDDSEFCSSCGTEVKEDKSKVESETPKKEKTVKKQEKGCWNVFANLGGWIGFFSFIYLLFAIDAGDFVTSELCAICLISCNVTFVFSILGTHSQKYRGNAIIGIIFSVIWAIVAIGIASSL